MTDRLEKLEAELKRLRPGPMRGEVAERIGGAISTPVDGARTERTWIERMGDRILLAMMSGAAVAVCVIVTIVMTESAGAPTSPNIVEPSVLASSALPTPRAGDTIIVFVQADAFGKQWEISR